MLGILAVEASVLSVSIRTRVLVKKVNCQRPQRQYLYFCTAKVSKLSTLRSTHVGNWQMLCASEHTSAVSIRTFVLVKQVNLGITCASERTSGECSVAENISDWFRGLVSSIEVYLAA